MAKKHKKKTNDSVITNAAFIIITGLLKAILPDELFKK